MKKLLVLFVFLFFVWNLAGGSISSYVMVGIPSSLSDSNLVELNASQYGLINVSDDLRLLSYEGGTSAYDSHVFVFNMSDSINDVSRVATLNFSWEGYGENSSGYYTNISIWDWTNGEWDLLNSTDFSSSGDILIENIVSSGLTDYINSTTKEVGFLVTTQKNYSCGAGHTDNGDGTCSVILRPIANGSSTAFSSQYPGSGEHWDKVDDVTADEGGTLGTYIYSASSTSIPPFYIAIKENGVTSYGSLISLSDLAWNNYVKTWTTRPSDGDKWTVEDINNLEIGVRAVPSSSELDLFNISSTSFPDGAIINSVKVLARARARNDLGFYTARLTQIYATITYTPKNVLHTDYVHLGYTNVSISETSEGTSGSSNKLVQRYSNEGLKFYVYLRKDREKSIEVEDKLNLGVREFSIKASNLMRGNIEIFEDDGYDCVDEPYVGLRGYNIEHEMDNEDIESVLLQVTVPKNVVNENDIEEVKGIKCGGELSVKKVGEDEENYVYELESDGFSKWYLIGVLNENVAVEDETIEDIQESEMDDLGEEELEETLVINKSPFNYGLVVSYISYILLFVGTLYLFFREISWKKLRKE